jgi:hypothetical protein
VSGVSRNRGGFVKCVTIKKRLGIRVLKHSGNLYVPPASTFSITAVSPQSVFVAFMILRLRVTISIKIDLCHGDALCFI